MITVSDRRAIDLVTRLMAIPGPSGQEGQVAQFVVDHLLRAGLPRAAITFDTAHRRSIRKGEIGNLIVKLPGNRRLPTVMLSAHMDTVPICVGCKPRRQASVIVSADSRTGLGGDDRAGVAAILNTAVELLEKPTDHGPLVLCFFVQEEIGLQGSRHLNVSKLGKPRLAFNFDGGSACKLTVGATGGERIRIVLLGLAAHAGLAPEKGANAIEAASLAIANLKRHGWLGAVRKRGRVGTSNVGIIHGGSATNVVCDRIEIDAEARSHDGDFRNEIASAICDTFERVCPEVTSSDGVSVRVEIARRVDYESFRLSESDSVVQAAVGAVRDLGGVPEIAISNGGVDANWLVKHGIPTVTLGCGQRNVHTASESLDISDYLMACRIAKRLAVGAGHA